MRDALAGDSVRPWGKRAATARGMLPIAGQLSVGRAAQILRCSARMVRAYIAAGELRALPMETPTGHQWVLLRGDVLRVLVARNERLERRPPTWPAQLRLPMAKATLPNPEAKRSRFVGRSRDVA